MTWSYALWAVFMLVFVAGYYFINNRRQNANGSADDDVADRARLLADRADPRKYWAQAAIALYQDKSDPGCWKQEDALQCLQQGWSTPNAAELVELIQSYIRGECNLAFDKLRRVSSSRKNRPVTLRLGCVMIQ